jgi:amino acid adenylation domain-containing protein
VNSLDSFLAHLRELKIQLSLDGEKLSCRAPKGVMTKELNASLAEKKLEIIEFLKQAQDSRTSQTQLIGRRIDQLPMLSFSQNRLWFLYTLEGASATYNMPLCLKLQGHFKVSSFEKALNIVIDRHESLRSNFYTSSTGPTLRIAKQVYCTVEQIDLRTDSGRHVNQLIEQFNQSTFDLSSDLLVRAMVIQTEHEVFYVSILLHHIVADGWSIEILFNELRQAYTALIEGSQVVLPPLPIQYTDYSTWLAEQLTGDRLTKLSSFWKTQLLNCPDSIQLPTDFPRPNHLSYKGKTFTYPLSANLSSLIKDFSQVNNCTPYMTLLTGFSILLAHHANQEEIVIGSPVANRNHTDLEKLIGLFINTLPLRCDLSGNPTVIELLQRVRKTCLDGFAHQEIPFEKIVEEINPPRSLNYAPLYQVSFDLQNRDIESNHFSGLQVQTLIQENTSAKFDLSLTVADEHDAFVCSWNYAQDLFNLNSIEQLAQRFELLLSEIVKNAHQRIRDISLLNEIEKKQFIDQGKSSSYPLPPHSTFLDFIRQNAIDMPDRIALTFEDQAISYQELDFQSTKLASILASKGASPEKLIGLYVNRSIEMVIALLGILKSGAAYIPLDPHFPAERVNWIIEDGNPLLLITEPHLAKKLRFDQDRVIYLQELVQESAPATTELILKNTIHALNTAYVIFTSGSTGRPKGVQVTHQSLLNFMCSMQNQPGFTKEDKLLAVTTISFDIAGLELFLPLVSGGQLVLASRETAIDGRMLQKVIREQGITCMQATPATWQILLSTAWKPQLPFSALCGGEALSKPISQALLSLGLDLWNLYGPTETTIWSAARQVHHSQEPAQGSEPIGAPTYNTQLYILGSLLKPLPSDMVGELFIGGIGLARGYLNRPALTAAAYHPDPFSISPGSRLYATGDLVRQIEVEKIEYIGRKDFQIKIRGYRIEIGEIESHLQGHPNTKEVIVTAKGSGSESNLRLLAYLVPKNASLHSEEALRAYLKNSLPDYMLPTQIIILDALPLTPNGKIDRKALPEPLDQATLQALPPNLAHQPTQQLILGIWQQVLSRQKISIDDNFFDLGGHSLLLTQVNEELRKQLSRDIPLIKLFECPTIRTLSNWLNQENISEVNNQKLPLSQKNLQSDGIAIIGMAARFPGADDLATFWNNLIEGKESIRFFSEEELISAGVEPELIASPNYIRGTGTLSNITDFDAEFFSYIPAEAKLIDPQQRIFLETAWQALENSGYANSSNSTIGVFAGVGHNDYLVRNVVPYVQSRNDTSVFQVIIGNDKDFLATRVSYAFNLTGPSITLQTACSTSLVAVHSACSSLLNGECDMALAGGVAIKVPHIGGYLHEEGMISSKDGHCRAFDENANGTVWGSGAGVVILKPLQKAIEDRDTIHAVIKGSAINNDGSSKIGFTAPSVNGQSAVIHQALANAKIPANSISYIETHGTGTDLGDLIEITALKEVFPSTNSNQSLCAIGSVKTNIGHLNTAAGIAGLMKTVLALQNKQIPATLHFQKANPKLGLENSQFYVPNQNIAWSSKDMPRRAGVSSFGIGGTNAHVVLEEAPTKKLSQSRHQWQIIPLSAKTPDALRNIQIELGQYLKANANANLGDIAFTLAVGRKQFPYRTSYICQSVNELASTIESKVQHTSKTNSFKSSESHQIIFLFPGQGTQFLGMGRSQYVNEPLYREIVDYCALFLLPTLAVDIREFILHEGASHNKEELIQETWLTQPFLFITEYALAKLWMSWGIKPDAMIGHSLGEYVAACIAGVMDLDTALILVVQRGKLMWGAPRGSMLAISQTLDEIDLTNYPDLSIAAINLDDAIVVSGPEQSIDQLSAALEKKNLAGIKLQTSHAFHSGMMDCILPDFEASLKDQHFLAPSIPYISNLTGTWITPLESQNPDYWVRHLRSTVQFSKGLDTLLDGENLILLEVGPRSVLSSLVKKKSRNQNIQAIIPSLISDNGMEQQSLYEALSSAWKAGLAISWEDYYAPDQLSRIPLPTYPFERKRYWIDAPAPGLSNAAKPSQGRRPLNEWFYLPHWRPTISPAPLDLNAISHEKKTWLILANESALCKAMISCLQNLHQEVITVSVGEKFELISEGCYTIAPFQETNYFSLITTLQHTSIYKVLHFWAFDGELKTDFLHRETKYLQEQAVGFYSLIYLSKAFAKLAPANQPIDINIIADRLHDVYANGSSLAMKATLIGPSLVIPQEVPQISVHCFDVDIPHEATSKNSEMIYKLLSEFINGSFDRMVAYRGNQRMVPSYQQVELKADSQKNPQLRAKGVYLITGGLGRVGLLIAQYLNKQVQGRICLISRTVLPPKEEWLTHCQNESPVKEILETIIQLEHSGSEVLVISADVANQLSLDQAFTLCKERFGEIHGVFHAAGLPSLVTPFLEMTPEIITEQFAAKVVGSINLGNILNRFPADFCCLLSSTSAVLGGLGYSAYSAANIFLDHFANIENGRLSLTRWLSINWDAWNFAKALSNFPQGLEFSMSPTESMDALDRVIRQYPSGRIIVATGDLDSRLKNWVTREDWGNEAARTPQEQYSRPDLNNPYSAPITETEILLTEIWQSLLGYSEIGIDDNFFDLGGDSMLAIRLMSDIKVKFQRQLPLTVLLDKPNIKELAQLLDIESNQSTSTPLVALQSKGTLSPVFCVPGTGGSVLYLRSLANEFLKLNRPFYGLQAILSPETSKPMMDIRQIAHLNIQAIQKIQASGPYLLCGHSFGSWVALEMAFQLQDAGHKVSQLIILDTGIPSEKDLSRIQNWDDGEWLMMVAKIIGDTYDKKIDLNLKELSQLDWEGQIQLLFSQMNAHGLIDEHSGIDQVRSLVEMYKAQAQTIYSPKFAKVPNLTLIRAKTVLDDFLDGMPLELKNDPFWGWGKFSDKKPILEFVPGTHLTMVQPPNAHILADILGIIINQNDN